jgi:hypothetical protein
MKEILEIAMATMIFSFSLLTILACVLLFKQIKNQQL